MLWSTLGPLKKIKLATECCVEPWLLEGYTVFVTRAEAILIEEEERLGWDRAANLFHVWHCRLGLFKKSDKKLYLDIRTTFTSEFTHIAVFDNSPISYLRPELHTAVNPGIIQRDKTYYHIYIILSINFFAITLIHVEELLGMKATSKLFRIHDKHLQNQQNHGYWYRDSRNSVMSEVKQLFAEELKETIQE